MAFKGKIPGMGLTLSCRMISGEWLRRKADLFRVLSVNSMTDSLVLPESEDSGIGDSRGWGLVRANSSSVQSEESESEGVSVPSVTSLSVSTN